MKLIVDSNRIIAGLIRDGGARKVLNDPLFTFFAPDYTLEEIRRHEEEICEKAGIPKERMELLLALLVLRIEIVPKSEYEGTMGFAKALMGERDPDDAPFLACALAMKADGIWSEDADFEQQDTVRIWKTRELLALIGHG